jgi:hypothetical protein
MSPWMGKVYWAHPQRWGAVLVNQHKPLPGTTAA